MQPRVLRDDAAAIADLDAAIALPETVRQFAVSLDRQPEPKQVAAPFRLRPVDEAGSVVQLRVIAVSPVLGFLPIRSPLCRISNAPKLVSLTSSLRSSYLSNALQNQSDELTAFNFA